MRVVGQILLVCLIIAAFQGLVAVLAIAIVLFLIWGILFRTSETVGLLIVLGLVAALQAHPWVTICVGMVLGAAVWIAPVREAAVEDKPPTNLLQPPDAN